jgi:trimeric autotransporter adhesin
MDSLPSDVQSLINHTRQFDGPTTRDKERVGHKLNVALAAVGSAAGALAVKSVAAATVSGEAALTSAAVSAANTAQASTIAASSIALSGAATSAAGAAATSAAGAAATSAAGAAVTGVGATTVGAVASGGIGVTTAATALGLTAGKAAVVPVALGASKWSGGTLAAWLLGVSVVGAGATVGAPRVVQWVNGDGTTVVQPANTPTSSDDVTTPRAVVKHDRAHGAATGIVAQRVRSTEVVPNAVVPSVGVTAVVPSVGVTAVVPSVGVTAVVPSVGVTAVVPSVGVTERPLAVATVGAATREDGETEVVLLARAQRALASGDASTALLLLREHEQRFASSALSAERSAARVFAFCQLGRVEQARKAAAVFFRNGTSSPLTPKVRASCINLAAADESSTNPDGAGN